VKLIVVVPTRNRASLAERAVQCVLDAGLPNVRVIVSDNSTVPEQTEQLSSLCKRLNVRYLTPPNPMPMTPHWDWAINQAMADADATHFTYLTDRMVFRPGALRALVEIASALPSKVISYNHDLIDDFSRPVRLHEFRWTGRVVEIDSTYLLGLAARSQHPPCNPRFLNSVAPRAVIEHVRSRFGNVFDSISPDFCWAYRCLDLEDTIVYWDRSALINYAYDRSNGAGYLRGVHSADSADFQAQLGSKPMNADAPVPEFWTITNAVMNEYCFVKRESGSARFPEVARGSYLEAMAREIDSILDPDLRAAQRELLVHEGGAPDLTGASPVRRRLRAAARDPLRVARRAARRALANSSTQEVWRRLGRAGLKPPSSDRFSFDSTEGALEWTYQFPRRATGRLRRLDFLNDREHVRELELNAPKK
jgi:hypothetical protein